VIGDSVEADVKGAYGVGLRSILIGGSHRFADRSVATVAEVPEVLANYPVRRG
jgi:ribonucleotide monophosphatase NagD (HAD superfamily)